MPRGTPSLGSGVAVAFGAPLVEILVSGAQQGRGELGGLCEG